MIKKLQTENEQLKEVNQVLVNLNAALEDALERRKSMCIGNCFHSSGESKTILYVSKSLEKSMTP